MGSSDALSGSSAPEIGIFRAPDEPAGVFVNRVRALHVAQIGHGQERRHIGVVHKLRAAETVDLEGVDFSELRMLHDSVLLQCPGHLVGQRRALGGKLPLAVHRRQDLGGLAQRRDGHEVRRHEESEGRGVVRGAERRDDQPHGFHGVAAPHMAAGVQLTVRRAQEGVIARTLLHLLFAQRLHDVAHRRGPLPVEDRRVARGLPVVVRKAQRITMGVDLPLAFEDHRVGLRKIRLVVRPRRRDVESVGIGVDVDQLQLAADHPRDHLLQRRVLLAQLHVGPHLRPRVAEPHGRNVARVDVGIGIARLVLAVVYGGVERVGEAVGEHPP